MAENGYANPVLVTTEWAAEHLGDDGLVVAEVDENPDLYEEGHIPGAVKLHWREDLQDPVERDIVDRKTFESVERLRLGWRAAAGAGCRRTGWGAGAVWRRRGAGTGAEGVFGSRGATRVAAVSFRIVLVVASAGGAMPARPSRSAAAMMLRRWYGWRSFASSNAGKTPGFATITARSCSSGVSLSLVSSDACSAVCVLGRIGAASQSASVTTSGFWIPSTVGP